MADDKVDQLVANARIELRQRIAANAPGIQVLAQRARARRRALVVCVRRGRGDRHRCCHRSARSPGSRRGRADRRGSLSSRIQCRPASPRRVAATGARASCRALDHGRSLDRAPDGYLGWRTLRGVVRRKPATADDAGIHVAQSRARSYRRVSAGSALRAGSFSRDGSSPTWPPRGGGPTLRSCR